MVKSLTKEELKKLLAAIPQERHKLMILTAFWHALRCSEVINLRARDIQGGYLSVQRLKGSKKTIQPFVYNADPELSEMEGLTKLAEELKPKEKLFGITRFGVYKLMQRAGERAGLPPHKCHPHVLKHSIAMVMKNGKKDVKEVQEYLGHVEGKNTLVYWETTMEQAAAGLGELL
jgi:integrase/recombinase XerD